jgi:hypothetical protein
MTKKNTVKKTVKITCDALCPCCGTPVNREKLCEQGIGLITGEYADKIIADTASGRRKGLSLRDEIVLAFIAGAEHRRIGEHEC